MSLDTPVIMVQSGTAGHRRFTDKNLTYVSVSHLLWDPHFLSHSVFHRFRQAKVCGVYKKGYIRYQWKTSNSRSNMYVVAWICCSHLQNQEASYRKESTTLKSYQSYQSVHPLLAGSFIMVPTGVVQQWTSFELWADKPSSHTHTKKVLSPNFSSKLERRWQMPRR